MRGWLCALLTAAVAVAGCKAGVQFVQPEKWDYEVAHGQRFANEEFGQSAIFPRGSGVCVVQSGTHHHGYFARPGYRGPGCLPSSDTPELTVFAFDGQYNAAFYRTLAEARSESCSTQGLGDDLAGSGGRALTIPGLVSEVCEEVLPHGRVMIEVLAFAGSQVFDLGEPDGPALIYSAWLTARRENLSRDKPKFEAMLSSMRAHAPVDDSTADLG